LEAIEYVRSVPRYLAVKALYRRLPGIVTSHAAVIRLRDVPEPKLPNDQWVRVHTRLCGICGSDLATVAAKGSPYFSPLLSFPFVLGHEVVGTLAMGTDGLPSGTRVVVEPALHCAVRGISLVCPSCERGDTGTCENITRGSIAPGIQTGYCRDTGGGWSRSFVAHPAQLYAVPDDLTDEEAALIEPFACSLHAVIRTALPTEATILVLGCGTIGLLTVAAIRALGFGNRVLASAKYPHQQEWARTLGATDIVPTGSGLYRAIPDATGALTFQPELGKPVLVGGVDVTFDCVGSSSSIDDAIRLTRSGGSVTLVGMPGIASGVDWTNIWHKELTVRGAYAYGVEKLDERSVKTFDLAMELMRRGAAPLGSLVTTRHRLADYRNAIRGALASGPNGSVKTVFEFPRD